jgi:preprotein translocase subunit YajC
MFGRNQRDKSTGGIVLNQLLIEAARALGAGAAFAADEAAQTGAPQQASLVSMLPMLIAFGLIFYFLMYRPQKKKQQEHEKMINSIGRGDTVVTAGGFYGKIREVLDDSYIIELDEDVKARILKGSVSKKVESGEDKPRPKKLKKKRREREKTTDENGVEIDAPASLELGGSSKAQDEGVSVEENDALMDGLPEETETASASSEKAKDA